MTLELPEKAGIHRVFDAIAVTYDKINMILSFGIDRLWRKKVVSAIPKTAKDLLDLATGTGDQLFAVANARNLTSAIGVDLSCGMLEVARKKQKQNFIQFVEGDAQNVPLENGSVDTVTMSFGIRNVPDPEKCLREMHRALRPGGRACILEFSLPKNRLIKALHLFYLRKLLPKIGRLLSKHTTAYTYLNETIETFPYGKAFTDLMHISGFENATATPLTFGVATLYVATKPR